MKLTVLPFNIKGCDFRVEEFRDVDEEGFAPFRVYLLSTNHGKGPGRFVGYFKTFDEVRKEMKRITGATYAQLPTHRGNLILPGMIP
jgi:hypothetical protein